MIRFPLFLLLIACIPFRLWGQPVAQKAIDRLLSTAQLSAASTSICLIDRQTGAVLASHQPDQSLIPASTLKVLTTATALALLGEDFRYQTHFEYDGRIEADGTLRGNLYLRGTGDPTLASPQLDATDRATTVLDQLVTALEKAGIRRIEGQVVGDASHFEGAPLAQTWPWEDLGNYYAAGAWGLNWHENLYFLHLQQASQLGARPEIFRTDPEVPNLLLVNELQSAARGTGDNAYLYGVPYAYTRIVRGTIPVGSGTFTIKGSLPDPPFQAAHELLMALAARGIRSSGGATSQWERRRTGTVGEEEAPRQSLLELRSPALREIVRVANHQSVNLYCEALLKTLGKLRGRGGTTEAGLEVVREFWSARGLDDTGLYLMDGSGLSPRNGITSRHLCTVLRLMAAEKAAFGAFYDSLPIGGRSGTLRSMFRGTVAEGRLRGKSGGMERVRGYTGYVRTTGGRELVYAVLVNNYAGSGGQMRAALERLLIEFCKG